MGVAVEIGVLLPVVGPARLCPARLWSSGLRAARLSSAGTLAWVLGIVPAAGVLLAGARAAVILAVARVAAGILPAGVLAARRDISRMLPAGILAAGIGHSGERPARISSARISSARISSARIRPARVDAALSADGIAAVGRHPGGDIDGPVPLLRLRRRRGRHN